MSDDLEAELTQLRKRVDELEILSAFQERTLSLLDTALRGFSERVDQVEGRLDTLQAKLKQGDSPEGQSPS